LVIPWSLVLGIWCFRDYCGEVSFQEFGLSDEVVHGVQSMGFVDPTPIQLRSFPIILAGKDLIGTAQTGTGKTAAFALPILTLLAGHGKFRCLVLEPTRELAAQVETAFRDYGRFTAASVTESKSRT
jgi:ATP-dependent RNA helicase RhlE